MGHKSREGKRDYAQGALSQLLETAVTEQCELHEEPYAFEVVDAQTLQDLRVHRSRRGRVFNRKIGLALHNVEELRAQGIAILVDRERPKDPDPREAVLAEAERFREDADCEFAVVAGAPCRSLETWLLADAEARRAAFGSAGADPFSGDPEHRPPPRELKKDLERRCEEAHLEVHDARRVLAGNARPKELARRCPESYGPFLKDVTRELRPLCSDRGG